MKNEYDFYVVLGRLDIPREEVESKLFSTCDDGLIYFRNGIVSMSFNREASSYRDAVYSAIQDIKKSGINAQVKHIEGEYLNLSELEDKTGVSKQSLSLYSQGKRVNKNFPIPSKLMSSQPIYPLDQVALWLYTNEKISEEKYQNLIEEARSIKEINFELENTSTKFGSMGKTL